MTLPLLICCPLLFGWGRGPLVSLLSPTATPLLWGRRGGGGVVMLLIPLPARPLPLDPLQLILGACRRRTTAPGRRATQD